MIELIKKHNNKIILCKETKLKCDFKKLTKEEKEFLILNLKIQTILEGF